MMKTQKQVHPITSQNRDSNNGSPATDCNHHSLYSSVSRLNVENKAFIARKSCEFQSTVNSTSALTGFMIQRSINVAEISPEEQYQRGKIAEEWQRSIYKKQQHVHFCAVHLHATDAISALSCFRRSSKTKPGVGWVIGESPIIRVIRDVPTRLHVSLDTRITFNRTLKNNPIRASMPRSQ